MKLILAIFTLIAIASALVVGGYNPVSCNDEMAAEAVAFAEKEINSKSNSLVGEKLVKCVSCESQVVAGVNFHCVLRMAMQDTTNAVHLHDVTVYRNLQGKHQMTAHTIEHED